MFELEQETERAALAIVDRLRRWLAGRGAPVLVTAPPTIRRARLAAPEEAAFLATWYARWTGAEARYFTEVRPPESFDIVITIEPCSPKAGTLTPSDPHERERL